MSSKRQANAAELSGARWDVRSRWYRLAISFAAGWFVLAAILAWQRYQDARPVDGADPALFASTCHQDRLAFEGNEIVGNRKPTAAELQACLEAQAPFDAALKQSSERWAQADALKWFALWGLAMPLAIVLFIAARSKLAALVTRLGRSYWGWVKGGEAPK